MDDHELIRLGFRALVAAQPMPPGAAPPKVLEAGTLAQALAIHQQYAPEITVAVSTLPYLTAAIWTD